MKWEQNREKKIYEWPTKLTQLCVNVYTLKYVFFHCLNFSFRLVRHIEWPTYVSHLSFIFIDAHTHACTRTLWWCIQEKVKLKYLRRVENLLIVEMRLQPPLVPSNYLHCLINLLCLNALAMYLAPPLWRFLVNFLLLLFYSKYTTLIQQ